MILNVGGDSTVLISGVADFGFFDLSTPMHFLKFQIFVVGFHLGFRLSSSRFFMIWSPLFGTLVEFF